ncbi:MAG: hypothetical protein IKV85_03790 [Ruminococcus sp.]|nr:hypothetical protein [Ruminococcus sp.]
MKLLKLVALFISSVFLVGCIDITVTDYAPSVDREQNTSSDSYMSEQEVYDGLVQEMAKGNLLIDLYGVFEDDTLTAVLRRIENDFPEYYWIGYEYYLVKSSGTFMETTSTVSFHGADAYEPQVVLDKLYEIEAASNQILSSIPQGLDDFEKALYVYDYIANTTVYATDRKGVDEIGTWDTVYGCLVLGEAVCGGYSKAFSYVMKRLGIDCGVVTGEVADENGENVGHAWNYIMIDNKYYWLDLTWDDTDDETDPVSHTYFLIDDMRMNKNRILHKEQFFVPTCYSMEQNFFVRYDSYLTVYNAEDVGQAMMSSPDEGKVELMFSSKQAYDAAFTSLFENGELWSLTEYADISESVSYSKNDNMYVLSIQY